MKKCLQLPKITVDDGVFTESIRDFSFPLLSLEVAAMLALCKHQKVEIQEGCMGVVLAELP